MERLQVAGFAGADLVLTNAWEAGPLASSDFVFGAGAGHSARRFGDLGLSETRPWLGEEPARLASYPIHPENDSLLNRLPLEDSSPWQDPVLLALIAAWVPLDTGGGGGSRQVYFCDVPPVNPPCDDEECPPASRGSGGIGSGTGGVLGIGAGLGDKGAFARNFSGARVRYGDGMTWVRNRYIPGGGGPGDGGFGGGFGGGRGFGTPWGVSRHWSNLNCSSSTSPAGMDSQSEFPYLRRKNGGSDNQIYVISDGLNVRLFEPPGSGGVYGGGSFYLIGQERFVHDSAPSALEFVLTTTTGVQFKFHDFDVGGAGDLRQGRLKSITDAYGNATSVSYSSGGPLVVTVERGGPPQQGRPTEQIVYTYRDASSQVLLQAVLKRSTDGGSTWPIVRQADYTYYGLSENYGNLDDLKQVEVKDQTLSPLDTYYYRYYKVGEANGYEGGLKFVFGPESFARLAAAAPGFSPPATAFTATDAQVAPYADRGFEYFPDSDTNNARKVKKATIQGQGCSACSGGQGTFQYSYTPSTNPNDLNKWKFRTVETLPDGNEHIVYTNYAGQVMLKDFGAAGGAGDRWVHYYRYDADGKGQVVLHAMPSAIQKSLGGQYYDDTKADLVDADPQTGRSKYLADNAGFIETATFHTGTTTATASIPGDVNGYLVDTRLKQGELGTSAVQTRTKYFEHVPQAPGYTDMKIHPVAQATVYRVATSNPDDSSGQPRHTSFAYQWRTISSQTVAGIDRMDVTHAAVSAAQNGPAAAEVQSAQFSKYGWPVWQKDGDGYLHYAQYDAATGAAIRTITDAAATVSGDTDHGTAPWSALPGTRLQLTTLMDVDGLGRTTKLTDPKQNVTYTVYNDFNHEMRTYPGWYTTVGGPCDSAGGTNGCTTGPIGVRRQDRALSTSYEETLTMSRTSVPATSGKPNGSETIGSSTLQTLVRTFTSPGGQIVEVNAYHNLATLSHGTQAVLQNAFETTHYYKTEYGYDNRGRPNRVKLPTGTIQRTVYDGLNRPIRYWVGTSEGGSWSETSPGDLRIVAANVYDGTDSLGGTGGVGDSNRMQQIAYPTPKLLPTDPEPANRRVTRSWFDWRNRAVASKQGVQSSETDDINRPLVAATLNNLGQVVMGEQYDGDTLTSPPVPTNPADCHAGRTWASEPNIARRRGCVNTDYDERGRAYKTRTFYVYQQWESNPGQSAVRALAADTWYSLRGQVLKTAAPGGLVKKTQYDGAGRAIKQFASDGGGDPAPGATDNWLHADDVLGDFVLEQTETQYDAASLPQLETRRRRFHDETATGELVNKDTAPKARVTYVGRFYDKANRLTAVVGVGTYGGSAYPWNFDGPPPGRSDTVLVSDYQYHPAGWLELETDPRALVRKTTYDNLGRAKKVVENFSGTGDPTATTNSTTEWTYDGSGHVLTHTARLPAGEQQTTGYVYAAQTGAGGSDVNSNELLTTVKHPDRTTGLPSTDLSQQEFYFYNGVGQQKTARYDRNGTYHFYAYDVVGRRTFDSVSLGTGVDGAVQAVGLSYDDAGRPHRLVSYTTPEGTTAVNEVQQRYNGFGQLTVELQEHNGAVVTGSPALTYSYSFDPAQATGPNHSRPTGYTYPVSTLYPSGRPFTYAYNADVGPPTWAGVDDRISRPSAVKEGATTLEGYTYLGLNTLAERTHPQPNVNLTYVAQTGDPTCTPGVPPCDGGDPYRGLDRFDRVVDQRWRKSDGTHADRFGYGYDRNGNRLYRDNLHADTAAYDYDELYHAGAGYDGFNQLTNFARGQLNAAKTGLEAGTLRRQIDWTFDALGNWNQTATTVPPGGPATQTRTHNKQNQLTSISTPDVTPVYDNNGNTIEDEKDRGLFYDAWDRLVEVRTAREGGSRLVRYTYDALGRRVCETAGNPDAEKLCAVTAGTRRDFYHTKDWQVAEERLGGAVQAHYVWSLAYVDGLVLRDRDTGGASDLDERLYVQQDANWNVTAVVNISGGVVERFVYDPYGKPTFVSAAWVGLMGSGVAWQYLHQGGRYHGFGDGTGLYHFRRRELSSSLGRWIQADPTGFKGGDANLYRFVHNRPSVLRDPTGLVATPETLILGELQQLVAPIAVWIAAHPYLAVGVGVAAAIATCVVTGPGVTIATVLVGTYQGSDKLAHCEVSCQLTKCLGSLLSWALADVLKEYFIDYWIRERLVGLLQEHFPNINFPKWLQGEWEQGDLDANRKGRECGGGRCNFIPGVSIAVGWLLDSCRQCCIDELGAIHTVSTSFGAGEMELELDHTQLA